MKNLGLKKMLLLSVMILVGLSVSISSFISYKKEEAGTYQPDTGQ